jgi:hypothetical protein
MRLAVTHGRDEKYVVVLLEILKGRDKPEDLGVDGNLILESIFGTEGDKL